jgi:surface antigen
MKRQASMTSVEVPNSKKQQMTVVKFPRKKKRQVTADSTCGVTHAACTRGGSCRNEEGHWGGHKCGACDESF